MVLSTPSPPTEGRPPSASLQLGEGSSSAWTPSLWTEPCEQSGGAGWQRGPFKSHEPETLRNPRAIRLRSSVSPGSSCRARPAVVHWPSLSTGDESLAPRAFPSAGGSVLPVRPASRSDAARAVGTPGAHGTRESLPPGSRSGPGERGYPGEAPSYFLCQTREVGRQAVRFNPPAKGFSPVVSRVIQLVEALKKTHYPTVSLRHGTNEKQFGFTFPDLSIILISSTSI